MHGLACGITLRWEDGMNDPDGRWRYTKEIHIKSCHVLRDKCVSQQPMNISVLKNIDAQLPYPAYLHTS
jgi:hypothetical protein